MNVWNKDPKCGLPYSAHQKGHWNEATLPLWPPSRCYIGPRKRSIVIGYQSHWSRLAQVQWALSDTGQNPEKYNKQTSHTLAVSTVWYLGQTGHALGDCIEQFNIPKHACLHTMSGCLWIAQVKSHAIGAYPTSWPLHSYKLLWPTFLLHVHSARFLVQMSWHQCRESLC